jgi:hypothetical protein
MRWCRERRGDGAAMVPVCAGAGVPVQHALDARNLRQLARHPRAGAGDDERAVARADQRRVEMDRHLLGAAGRVGTDRRQGVGDAEDGEAQLQAPGQ